jgi:hypothetical protein
MYHGVSQSETKPLDRRPPVLPDEEEKAGAKKERVLHTRVPAVLERELKRFADNLRVPVSNLVRTILEDAVNVADAAGTGLEERLKKAARTLETERERLKKKVAHSPVSEIFAFQDITLAQSATCSECGKDLGRGTRAHLGLQEDGVPRGPSVIVCSSCLAANKPA